jgi:acetolactate synthase-1/2/3 large subunit
VIGSDAFQEVDVTGITLPITKHNSLVTDVRQIARTMREAFVIARSGRPGPVLVDITKDAQQAKTDFVYPETVHLPGLHEPEPPDTDSLERAVELIEKAERPLILAGAGVIRSGASQALVEFAEKAEIPVALTLLGIGGFPQSHPLCLGMMGMHGEAFVNSAIQRADLLLAFGMRFDDRVTGNLKTYALQAKKIHVEIDASEVNKNVKVDVGLVSDLLAALKALTPRVPTKRHHGWMAEIEKGRAETRSRDIIHKESNGQLLAPHVMHDLWKTTGGNSVIVTDVGQHQMWEAQYYKHDEPRTLITSGGLGTMGFALPAAIGAKFARPDAEVWVVAGDGGFQMTQCELATIQQEGLDIKIAVINNGFLGMVRQWQEFFHDKRYAATPILSPDYVKLAAAYDIPAERVRTRADVASTVQKARERRGPMLIEFQVEKEEAVYPMVPAGSDLHAMIRRPAEENAEVRS